MMQLDLFRCGKIKKIDFLKNILFLAIGKLRLSTYLCTPSGNPKPKFWLSLPIPKLFPYPLEKTWMLKNSGTQEKTYLSTPSGNPKPKFWLSYPIPKFFLIPLKKWAV